MDAIRPKSTVAGFWRLLVALLCITLVVASGTIQAVHSHAHDDVAHTDCSLCATVHVAIQVSQPTVISAVVRVVSFVEAVIPPARPTTHSVFALFTRPPPADLVLA